eukprot:Pompholyxophrys_sp_v1_NODE_1_length_32789_cov_6.460653.p30 type:complete len:122 gc:universal NODE_1_length_32789_cov_6.460653:8491-8126(-)
MQLKDSLLFYFACDSCIKSVARNYMLHNKATILGTSFDLDPVYIRWLQEGKQNIFRIHCHHPIAKRTVCYLKGDLKVYLGEPIQRGLHDYEKVKIYIQPTAKSKNRLINHFLLEEDPELRR